MAKNAIFEKAVMNGEGVMDVMPTELKQHLENVHLVDVRRPDEWRAELGHIKGVEFATLETNLAAFLDSVPATEKENDTFVFVCRSGARSGRAAGMATSKGFKNAYNMAGGMISWNQNRLPVER